MDATIIVEELLSKKQKRHDKKIKKVQAFLEVSKLNDEDRNKRTRNFEYGGSSSFSSSVDDSDDNESVPKKQKIEDLVTEGNAYIAVHNDMPADEHEHSLAAIDCTDDQKKPLATGISEYLKLKYELRERKKFLTRLPRIRLKEEGNKADISCKETDRVPVLLDDIQHMLSYSLFGPYLKPYNAPPRWCALEKVHGINRVMLLVFEGITLEDFKDEDEVGNGDLITKNIFNVEWDVKVSFITMYPYKPNIVLNLIAIPPYLSRGELCSTGNDQHKSSTDRDKPESCNMIKATFPVSENISNTISPTNEDKFDRTELLLSVYQMVLDEFPVPFKYVPVYSKKYSHYRLTKEKYTAVSKNSPLFAIDCEMCLTSNSRSELTRFTIVNEQEEVLYDTLVKPYNEINNYLTHFSGITADMLENVTTRLEDVQNYLIGTLPSDAILIGHSLNFDLDALQLMHPYVIDTSVIYNPTGDRMRKPKLKHLASRFLSMDIQMGHKGHNSIEDSIASMKLVKFKLCQSVHFGDEAAVIPKLIECEKNKKCKASGYTEKLSECEKNKKCKAFPYTESILEKLFCEQHAATVVSSESKIQEFVKYIRPNEGTTVISAKKLKHKLDQAKLAVSNDSKFIVIHTEKNLENLEKDRKSKVLKKITKGCNKMWNLCEDKDMCVVLLTSSKLINNSNATCLVKIKKPERLKESTTTSAAVNL